MSQNVGQGLYAPWEPQLTLQTYGRRIEHCYIDVLDLFFYILAINQQIGSIVTV